MDKEEKKKLKEWADAVKLRDNYKCAVCGSEEHPNAHHIIVKEIEDTRFLMDNGITLCIGHHKFSRKISAHNNPAAFFVWLMENRPQQYKFVLEFYKKNEIR